MSWDMSDEEFNALLDRDPIAALCYAVKASGCTMRLHGVPIEQEDLRAAASRHAKDRVLARLAPPLTPGPRIEEHW